MFRNYLAAAFGNLSRNWLYAGITIVGLAVGFAAAILVGLYVRDEYSFERFIAGYQDVYRLEMDAVAPGQKPARTESSQITAAGALKLDFPEVWQVARLARRGMWVGRGEAKTHERIAWTDPDFFRVLPYPVLAGDPVSALGDPNGVVIDRKMARKYFGVDAPIGKTLMIQTVAGEGVLAAAHPMVVKAVLKDVPSQTHLEPFEIFAPGRATWSPLTSLESVYKENPSRTDVSVWTYVRLRPGASPDRSLT